MVAVGEIKIIFGRDFQGCSYSCAHIDLLDKVVFFLGRKFIDLRIGISQNNDASFANTSRVQVRHRTCLNYNVMKK